MIEGETTAGYFCQLIVSPQEVAKIFIDYDYALYRVLGEDAPRAMWKDLGARVGHRACLLGGFMKAHQKRHKYPKYDKYYVGYSALSLRDNKTKIYLECGIKEVTEAFVSATNN